MRTRGLGRVYQPKYRDRKTGGRTLSPTWWIAYSFRGTKHRECSWSSKRQDAVRLLKKRLGEIGRGRFAGALLERTTFDDLEKIITDDYDVNGRRTKGRMLTALAALRLRFGLTLARDLTFDGLNAYIADRLKEGIAPATVRYDLSVLRGRSGWLSVLARLSARPSRPSASIIRGPASSRKISSGPCCSTYLMKLSRL